MKERVVGGDLILFWDHPQKSRMEHSDSVPRGGGVRDSSDRKW